MSSRRSAARPKRAGEQFARIHHADLDGPHSSKKAKFDLRNPSALAPDAPEDDAVLEADVIGKSGAGTKRNAVNIEGYDSDSSTENFDARADEKARSNAAEKNGPKEDEDDDDMFGVVEDDLASADEDEAVNRGSSSKKKDVGFLDEDEIEGQVSTSKSGGHVSGDFSLHPKGKQKVVEESSDSDEDENLDDEGVDEEVGDGGRKKHAPKLDAFNMKGEMEEGRFDDNQNFVRKALDPDAIHDSWLAGVSKKDMKRAREAAEKREEQERQRRLQDDQVLTSDILKNLILLLVRGETPLEALQRLGRAKAKKAPKWQTKNRSRKKDKNNMDIDARRPMEDTAEKRRLEEVEAITDAADQLLTRGQTEIYEQERELLIRQYKRETGEEWVQPSKPTNVDDEVATATKSTQWEYRWADRRDGGERHGPYEGQMMLAWQDAGFFSEDVEFRCIGTEDEWSRVVSFI